VSDVAGGGEYLVPIALDRTHETDEFACGDAELDEWLQQYALLNQRTGSARTFITTTAARSPHVLGYYALSAATIARASAPGRISHGMPEPVPVVLLGRLAVHISEQGEGVGGHLLKDAVKRTLVIAEQIGVRALLTHAANDRAASFYARYGFVPSPTDPLHMLLLLKDARKLL
jgi:predicted N-acetyltransferase YhbS